MQVLTATLDYLKDVVGMQLSQFPLPDINKVHRRSMSWCLTPAQVVESDQAHLGRLLQLILGVAINCDSQKDHIAVSSSPHPVTDYLLPGPAEDGGGRAERGDDGHPGTPGDAF